MMQKIIQKCALCVFYTDAYGEFLKMKSRCFYISQSNKIIIKQRWSIECVHSQRQYLARIGNKRKHSREPSNAQLNKTLQSYQHFTKIPGYSGENIYIYVIYVLCFVSVLCIANCILTKRASSRNCCNLFDI